MADATRTRAPASWETPRRGLQSPAQAERIAIPHANGATVNKLRPLDYLGLTLIGLIGVVPILAALFLSWWILFGGTP